MPRKELTPSQRKERGWVGDVAKENAWLKEVLLKALYELGRRGNDYKEIVKIVGKAAADMWVTDRHDKKARKEAMREAALAKLTDEEQKLLGVRVYDYDDDDDDDDDELLGDEDEDDEEP